ncbi:hypothetical protein [Bordetella trematum]|uniref:Uncharacterized protein n=1 Tax=Bordetella trematum TaxID=123899 RepID=A0A157SY57_9BORD|nr:hypothetical protein [Bordetella trematum]SAI74886.1 Uncharacterised protein [Bordetella trematum]
MSLRARLLALLGLTWLLRAAMMIWMYHPPPISLTRRWLRWACRNRWRA